MENPRKCIKCGTENLAEYQYCKKCGASLDEEKPQPQPRPAPLPRKRTAKETTIRQMGDTKTELVSFYDPFAGFGQRGRLVPWLLDNLGFKAEELRNAVTKRFSERGIPDAKFIYQTLSGKGILAESREYYLARRRAINVGVYISRFGKDLYISMVTYYKGAISPGKVLVLLTMITFLLLIPIGIFTGITGAISSEIISNYGEDIPPMDEYLGLPQYLQPSIGSLQQQAEEIFTKIFMTACCLLPIFLLDAIALTLGFIYSTYKLFSERDPWVLLRTYPNEFQQDDIIALQMAVERTVRQSLDEIGIDSSLMPPSQEYGIKRRII